nr:hypothetical protein StreXyl84_77320 [Streptomyces sp. Xyl84]
MADGFGHGRRLRPWQTASAAADGFGRGRGESGGRAAAPALVGFRGLTVLQSAADAALYGGKHSGRAVLATRQHVAVPSNNGRRTGRQGTAVWGRAA